MHQAQNGIPCVQGTTFSLRPQSQKVAVTISILASLSHRMHPLFPSLECIRKQSICKRQQRKCLFTTHSRNPRKEVEKRKSRRSARMHQTKGSKEEAKRDLITLNLRAEVTHGLSLMPFETLSVDRVWFIQKKHASSLGQVAHKVTDFRFCFETDAVFFALVCLPIHLFDSPVSWKRLFWWDRSYSGEILWVSENARNQLASVFSPRIA